MEIFVAPSLYINEKSLLTLILKVLSYIYIILYILLNMKCDIFSVFSGLVTIYIYIYIYIV